MSDGEIIEDRMWRNIYARAARAARKAGLPKATVQQRDFLLKICWIVEIGPLPEAWLSTIIDRMAEQKRNGFVYRQGPWAWLYDVARSNARDLYGYDLERIMARRDVPPSVLHGRL